MTVHYSSPQAPLVEASLAISDFGPLAIGSMLASVPPTLVVLLLAWVQHRRRRNTSMLAAPLLEPEAPSLLSRASWRASGTAFGAAPLITP